MNTPSNNLYLDIHALQILPPSCVNRDDTGAPKTAVYGGVMRARVSSQAWKKSIRERFKEIFHQEDLGIRTRNSIALVADQIRAIDPNLSDKAEKMAQKILEDGGIKIKKGTTKTEALTFLSFQQAKALAQLAVEGVKDKAKVKEALKKNPSFDQALFGRMVASDPDLNFDAACQVAHAISTHAADSEYDYFTATDDYKTENHMGAGHMGTVEFNSCTLYRYATINMKELYQSTGKKAPEVAIGFLDSFVKSMPSGKQNTFANHTLPEDIYISIRTDQPVSMAAAFETPVYSEGDGYTAGSAKRMEEYAAHIFENQLAEKPVYSVVIGSHLNQLGEKIGLKDAEVQIEAHLNDLLSKEVE